MRSRESTADETAAHLTRLARRIRDLEAVFSCGGTVTLDAPVTLRFADGRSIPVVRESGWKRTIGKKLMARCEPAPFGVGTRTVHDRRVRDGGQLLAKDGAVQALGIDLEGAGILSEVRRALCPADSQHPTAELYALNVYGPRGHFVAHKDTPRDTDVFGTLVLCLPVSFRGGSLVLRHRSVRRFAWEGWDTGGGFGFGHQDASYPVQWAAFYSDVDHAIEPVSEGTRVTLTWLLRRDASGTPMLRRPAARERDLEADLAAALADPRFLPSGGTLGVPCTHLYTATTARAPFAGSLTEGRTSGLKGRDRLVAGAALRAGLSSRVRPYLFETCGDESWRLARPPTARERTIFQRDRLGLSRIEETMPIEHHADFYSEDDVTWVLPPPWGDSAEDTPSPDAEPASDFLGEPEYSATDYFGNEGGHAAFYVSAAVLLEVPPARKRAVAKSARARAVKKTPGGRRLPRTKG
jgi:hypothetical protein